MVATRRGPPPVPHGWWPDARLQVFERECRRPDGFGSVRVGWPFPGRRTGVVTIVGLEDPVEVDLERVVVGPDDDAVVVDPAVAVESVVADGGPGRRGYLPVTTPTTVSSLVVPGTASHASRFSVVASTGPSVYRPVSVGPSGTSTK